MALLFALLVAPAPARADHPFEQGRIRLSLALGTGSVYDQFYYAAGGGFAVFVVDGLEVGVDGSAWFGQSPAIGLVSPEVRYIAYMVPLVHPYAGAFYRHWFVGSGRPDYDTVGGRGGIVWTTRHGFIVGLGGAYEQALNCTDITCAWIYPELWVSITL